MRIEEIIANTLDLQSRIQGMPDGYNRTVLIERVKKNIFDAFAEDKANPRPLTVQEMFALQRCVNQLSLCDTGMANLDSFKMRSYL